MRERFLFDTGPLQEFFVLRYQAESNRRWPGRTFQFQALLTPLDREDFERFVRVNRGHLGTSSGVVTEMHRFLRDAEDRCQPQDRPDLRRRFWGLVCATFRDLGIAEDAVPVVGMTEQALVDYGPVDAGLLELAKRPVKDAGRAVVLTADRRLHELCLQEGVSAEYVTDRLEKFRETAQ